MPYRRHVKRQATRPSGILVNQHQLATYSPPDQGKARRGSNRANADHADFCVSGLRHVLGPWIDCAPSIRGMTAPGAGMVTAITKDRSMPGFAAATQPPKTRLNEITKPTANITATAYQVVDETSVPSATSPPMSSPSDRRVLAQAKAKTAGMTTAARVARRSAPNPRSAGGLMVTCCLRLRACGETWAISGHIGHFS